MSRLASMLKLPHHTCVFSTKGGVVSSYPNRSLSVRRIAEYKFKDVSVERPVTLSNIVILTKSEFVGLEHWNLAVRLIASELRIEFCHQFS